MVGDILRREREKQGLTVADIEKGTSIRGLYIGCIEQGKVEELPGMVYAKGFVRNYAKFLGLDAEAPVQQFAEENGSTFVPVSVEPETKTRRISLSDVGDESLSQISIGGRSSSYASIFAKLAVGIIVLAALVGGGAALISAINTPSKEAAAPPPAKTEQAAPSSAAAETNTSDEARGTAPAQDVNVSVRLTERCWTEVLVDGKTVFEGLIEEGKTESWQGKDIIVIRAGNAGALDVTANGRKLGKFGKVGEVVERHFTKETKNLEETLAPGQAQEDEQQNTGSGREAQEPKASGNTKNRQ